MIRPVFYRTNIYSRPIAEKAKCDKKNNIRYAAISFCGENVNPKQAVFFSFESVPIKKVGGLADIVGELTPALNKKGMDVRVIIPFLISATEFTKMLTEKQSINPEITMNF